MQKFFTIRTKTLKKYFFTVQYFTIAIWASDRNFSGQYSKNNSPENLKNIEKFLYSAICDDIFVKLNLFYRNIWIWLAYNYYQLVKLKAANL